MDVLNHLAETNTWEYNHLKAIEELTELTEVLIKRVTKKDGVKEPPKQAVIDELGDVLIRVEILRRMYGPYLVDFRVDEKLSKFDEYIKEDKYTGKI